jgi:hypothetical protein
VVRPVDQFLQFRPGQVPCAGLQAAAIDRCVTQLELGRA